MRSCIIAFIKQVEKNDKMRGLLSIYRLFAMSLIILMMQKQESLPKVPIRSYTPSL